MYLCADLTKIPHKMRHTAHLKKALMGIALLCMATGVQAHRTTNWGRMDRSKLNIGTYYLQPYAQTEAHVRELMASGKAGVEVDLVVKSTPSSMHSFFELAPSLEGSDFCLTTVDTIFREKEFSDYIRANLPISLKL